MPNITAPITDVAQTVTRPVIYDVLAQIQKVTDIDPNIKIWFPGDTQKMQRHGSSINQTDRHALFNSERIAFIEVEEDYERENIRTTATTNTEHRYIFIDEALYVVITPIYATSNVTINYRYRSDSKLEVTQWRDNMRVKVSQMRDLYTHSLTYSYGLPNDFIEILQHIHELREDTDGYGDDFITYLSQHSTSQLTTTSDQAGIARSYVYGETQSRVLGYFDMDGFPDKPERDDSSGTWSVSFSYKFSYEKPISCAMRYPISIHNALLPEMYVRLVNDQYSLDKADYESSRSYSALDKFESDSILSGMGERPYVSMPPYDDYDIHNAYSDTSTIFLSLVGVEDDLRTLMNINELDDYLIDPDILNFIMTSERPFIHLPYRSVFNLALYRDWSLMEPMISLTPTGLIQSTKDLSRRQQHRIRLSIVNNLNLVDPKALDRLKNKPDILMKVILAILPPLAELLPTIDLPRTSIIPDPDVDLTTTLLSSIKTSVWLDIILILTGKQVPRVIPDLPPPLLKLLALKASHSGIMKTVQTTWIISSVIK